MFNPLAKSHLYRALGRLVLARVLMCLALAFAAGAASAQNETGLPFDLAWGMSKAQAEQKMEPVAAYRLKMEQINELGYRVPDQATKTVDGALLKFDADRLVEYTSAKTQLQAGQFERYFAELRRQARLWVGNGMSIVYEDTANNRFLYRDEKTYIGFLGYRDPAGGGGFGVDLTFTERNYFDKYKK